jgi:PAS domain S-box-containing protein
MRSILEGSPIGAAISVEDGRLLFCNSEFARQNGISRNHLEGVDLVSLFVDPAERTRLFERARREGRVRNIEIARRRTDGAHWWSLYSMDPIEYEGEKALLTWHYDITEIKAREGALAAAQAEVERTRSIMQTVLDNMKDGVSLYDKDLGWLFSNAQYPAIMHYPDGLIRPGVNLRDVVRHLTERGEYGPVEDVEGKVDEVIARLTTPGGIRYERRAASGKFVELNFKVLTGGELLGLYRDITELKEREEALASAKEAAEDARADVAAISVRPTTPNGSSASMSSACSARTAPITSAAHRAVDTSSSISFRCPTAAACRSSAISPSSRSARRRSPPRPRFSSSSAGRISTSARCSTHRCGM